MPPHFFWQDAVVCRYRLCCAGRSSVNACARFAESLRRLACSARAGLLGRLSEDDVAEQERADSVSLMLNSGVESLSVLP